MSTAWPLVQARLVALLPALDGFVLPDAVDAETDVGVHDGPPVGADTSNYFAVGYVEDEKGAGSFTQEPDGSGFFDIETGEVRCTLFVGAGDEDAMPTLTTLAFSLVNALKAYIVAHRDLGTLPTGSTVSLRSGDVQRGLDSSGAGVELILTLTYTCPLV